MKLSKKMKKVIIEEAQKLYREMYVVRCLEDPVASEVDITTFKEACYDMSMLVHFLAKDMYDVPDDENMILECLFRYEGKYGPHVYNKICGRTVDSTIMQFNNYSPYDNHDECYTEIQEIKYCDASIKKEVNLYKQRKFMKKNKGKRLLQSQGNIGVFCKINRCKQKKTLRSIFK